MSSGDILHAFHFLRPQWLLALPLSVGTGFLAGAAAQRRRRLVRHHRRRIAAGTAPRCAARRLRPWPWLALAWSIAALALSGPTWERNQTAAYRSRTAWVFVLDLSPSMASTDIVPNRVTRARYALDDLLGAAKDARAALVVFSDEPYIVTPLTRDVATVRALLPPLAPDIMPSPGDNLAPALEQASKLLQQVGAKDQRIVVLTDGFDDPAASFSAAAALRARGITLSVVGVGTQAGARPAQRRGKLCTGCARSDQTGAAGHRTTAPTCCDRRRRLCRYRTVAQPDRPAAGCPCIRKRCDCRAGYRSRAMDRQRHLAAADIIDIDGPAGQEAVVMMRALLALALLAIVLPAQAGMNWSGLWRNPDQQGEVLLQHGDAAAAARVYKDERRKAYAELKAGDYAAAARDLAAFDDSDANYNRGNALAYAGDLQGAISAYDAALKRDPHNQDASHNRELVENALKQQPPQQNSNSGQSKDGKADGNGNSRNSSPQDQDKNQQGGNGQDRARQPVG